MIFPNKKREQSKAAKRLIKRGIMHLLHKIILLILSLPPYLIHTVQ